MSLSLLCGVDEAGRGPLAGAVYAAAVILDENNPIIGLADSKKLSESKRDAFALLIKKQSVAWAIATASVEEIDAINILQASLLAMQRAVDTMCQQFGVVPELVQVDGNKCPKINYPCEAVVKGDSKVQAISAASILAKTARDAELYALDKLYPAYGFAQHKGYPTKLHVEQLIKYGVSPIHRKSFDPVKRLLLNT
jgi:ribonuclease HII